ncbi:MAG: hypothetical protein Q8P58_02810 [Candidatus Adlerbacteria bacterium]|nr:hypothetical protein [Candidatus Adlerbacteria bacterium]
MQRDVEKELQAAQKLGLSASEKAELRAGFLQFMDTHTSERAASRAVRSPFFMRFYAGALIAAAFFVYVGSAEAALPGDAMYYFKTRVNENVVRTLALTPELHTAVTRTLLERRLEETTRLAINTETKTQEWDVMLEELDRTSVYTQDNVETLIDRGEFADAIGAAEGQRALLSAHGVILAGISEQKHTTATQEVIEEVQQQQKYAEQIVINMLNSLSSQPDLNREAEESFDEAQVVLKQASSTLAVLNTEGDPQAAELQEVIEQAIQMLAEGEDALVAEDYDEALLKSEETERFLTEELVILQTEEEFSLEL